MKREEWARLGNYEISSMGRVRHARTHRIRKLTLGTNGYLHFSVKRPSGPWPTPVHRAVLEAFVGPAPEGNVARHLNGDKLDNRLRNLCWGTVRENIADIAAHGRKAVGRENGNARLTEEIVRDIRSSSEPGIVLARRYRVANRTITSVRRRETWAHVS